MKKILLIGLTLLFFQQTAVAADGCTNPGSDGELLSCTQQAKDVAEKALNQEYFAAKKRIANSYSVEPMLNKDYQQTLLASQRGWLKYRDGQCKLEAFLAAEGTSANATLVNKCITRLDNDRVKQLQGMPY